MSKHSLKKKNEEKDQKAFRRALFDWHAQTKTKQHMQTSLKNSKTRQTTHLSDVIKWVKSNQGNENELLYSTNTMYYTKAM